MTGIDRIAAERRRQIEQEGFTAEHDEENMFGELSGAATAYVALASRQIGTDILDVSGPPPSNQWRWSAEWWKPSRDPIRNLEKAGALIAAEIDRLEAQQ